MICNLKDQRYEGKKCWERAHIANTKHNHVIVKTFLRIFVKIFVIFLTNFHGIRGLCELNL